MLRTIALYKLVKVLLLLLVAYGELRLHDASLSAKLPTWAAGRPSGLEHEVVKQALAWFSGLSESRFMRCEWSPSPMRPCSPSREWASGCSAGGRSG